MIELKAPLWKLLAHGAAIYLIAIVMMRGRMLKRSLRQIRPR